MVAPHPTLEASDVPVFPTVHYALSTNRVKDSGCRGEPRSERGSPGNAEWRMPARSAAGGRNAECEKRGHHKMIAPHPTLEASDIPVFPTVYCALSTVRYPPKGGMVCLQAMLMPDEP